MGENIRQNGNGLDPMLGLNLERGNIFIYPKKGWILEGLGANCYGT